MAVVCLGPDDAGRPRLRVPRVGRASGLQLGRVGAYVAKQARLELGRPQRRRIRRDRRQVFVQLFMAPALPEQRPRLLGSLAGHRPRRLLNPVSVPNVQPAGVHIQMGRIEADQDQVAKEGHALVQAGPGKHVLQVVGLEEQARVLEVGNGLAAPGGDCVSVGPLHNRPPERRERFPGYVIAEVKGPALVFGAPPA